MTETILKFCDLIDAGSIKSLYLKAICTPILDQDKRSLSRIGKLGLVKEAAGKVRVFAMVDPWTQWLLYPLHKDIFSLLRRIPMDGTFNQTRPLRFASKWPCMYSYDLSSATDRLPILLQTKIISVLYNNCLLAKLWEYLLVHRGYKVPGGLTLQYSVGQPMGALSSWAMLAFTHHFIVQCAAWRSGTVPVGVLFKKYAVLGDDIVIGDRVIAKNYYKIITQLGVKVGLAKSVVSHNGLGMEFAKKTFCRGQNISAIPFKEYAVTSGSLPALIEFTRKYDMPIPSIVKMLGFGYKVLAKLNQKWVFQSIKIRRILIGLTIPIDDASFNKWVNQFPKVVSNETLESFRTLIVKELKACSEWMFKFQNFLYHDLSSWQINYAFFVASHTKVQTPINRETFNLVTLMKNAQNWDQQSHDRCKFYYEAVSLTFESLKFKMATKVTTVFSEVFALSDVVYMKMTDKSFYVPFKMYLDITKLIGSIPDKAFISNTRSEDDMSAKGMRDTLVTKVWTKWAPIISGSMPMKPEALSGNAPMESSFGFPLFQLLKRLVLVSSTVNGGILAKRISGMKVPMARFGLRTLLAVWFGELIFSSLFLIVAYGVFIALIAWYSCGSFSQAFSPIVLFSSSYLAIIIDLIHQWFYPPAVLSHYGIWHWVIEA